MLPQPVGGYRWISKMRGLFDRHIAFVRENGLAAVPAYAKQERKSFQDDGTAGPWGSVLTHDAAFEARFVKQDIENYLDIVADSRDSLYGSTFVCGAPPEELLAMDIPSFCWAGDDPAHAASAGHQLRELMPKLRMWDLHPSMHTGANQLEQILRFKQDVDSGAFPGIKE